MSVSITKGKLMYLKEIDYLKMKICVSQIRGEKFMEQINKNMPGIIKAKKNYLINILIGIGERSKIFYNEHLRSTISYDYLEVKRIREKNIENVLWDTLRNHWA